MKSFKLAGILYLLFSIELLLVAQNYDESNVKPYVLPEVLQTQNGVTVCTVDCWEKQRRPEILRLFEDNIYGQLPKDVEKSVFFIKSEDKHALEGKATLKEVEITVYRSGKSLTIHLILFIPNKSPKSPPLFLVINHRGMRTMDVKRRNKNEFFPVEEVIDAGYAIAGFDVKDVSPDNKVTYVKGVLELYPEQLNTSNGMGALGAWAWGASRIIDYLETEKKIDAKKIVVVGHSRGGKAALWCGAQDKRVAIAVSNDSGESGAAISNRNYGETVKDILKTFPYWFCKNYRQYVDNETSLPVDQHMLLALMAPRGVYVANASEDLWADPKGQYLSLLHAQPVFGLYGFTPDMPSEMPVPNKQIICSHMGFHNREGKHDMTLHDWQQFIVFSDNYFSSNFRKSHFFSKKFKVN